MDRDRSRSVGLAISCLRLIATLGVLGCADEPAGRPSGGAPIVEVDPPKPDDGASTVPGCDGVTESGTCQGSAAIYCNVERGALSRTDCAAFNQVCVVDARRGATCSNGPKSAPTSGLCEGNNAYWTDDGVLHRWDCSAEGTVCEIDVCNAGAYCCDTGAPQPDCCDATDPACTNPCSTDPGDGDGSEPTPQPPDGVDCASIGYEGVCTDASTVVYCVGDEPVTVSCGSDQMCQVDTCTPNLANCCATEGGGDDDECDDLGLAGECVGDQLRYCDNGSLFEIDCMGGCNPNCGDGSGACCDTVQEYSCADVNQHLGICDGNTLYYCIDGEITEQACGAQTCEIDTCFEGGADCC